MLDVCSSTQDETRGAPWHQPPAPVVGGVSSLLTYPPHIAPVPPPPPPVGIVNRPPPPSAGPAPQFAATRPPVGVPPPVGVLPPSGSGSGIPPAGTVSGILPAGSSSALPLAGAAGFPRPAGSVGGPLPPGSGSVLSPVGGVGIPPLPGNITALAPVGSSGGILPPGSVDGIPAPGSVVGTLPPAGGVCGPLPPASVAVFPPAGSGSVLSPHGSASGLLPPSGSVGVPPLAGIPRPSGVPLLPASTMPSGSRLSVAGPSPTAVLPPANVPPVAGLPRPPLGVPAAVNSSLPMPRFVAGFDLSVPPPAFVSPMSSMVVTSASRTPAPVAPRATEDMELDNSASSDDDLGEGFDEEWPVCSRRTSSKSHGSSQYDPFVRDRSIQLSQSPASGGSIRSAEPGSLQGKPVQYNDFFPAGSGQPNANQMPVTGNNFAVMSMSLDRVNVNLLPLSDAGVSFSSGATAVRSLVSLPHPGSMPPGMPRVPGAANPILNAAPSDVDFRTSSFGAGLVPVGPPPLPTPERLAPPPLPPLPRPPVPAQQLQGPVRPFVEFSLAGPSDKYAGVVSSGFSSSVAPVGTAPGPLGGRLGDVARPGSVEMSGNVPSSVSNVPGPMPRPPMVGTVNPHGMVAGAFHGPDNVPVRPGLAYPVPSGTFEPANIRPPPIRQVLVQGSMNPNSGMVSGGPDVGLVRVQVPTGVPAMGGGGPGSAEQFAGGSMPPANIGSLRGPAEFGGVRNVVPPDSVRFGLQPEMPRLPVAPPGSLAPGMDDTVGRMRQIVPASQGPLSMRNTLGQFAGASVQQNAPSLGPSERLLNALHSLAGMQPDSLKNRPSNDGGRTDIGPIQPVDAGMRPVAPGSSFGPQAGVGIGFGSPAVRNLRPEQTGMDVVGHSLPRGVQPAPPRLGTGLPRFPLSGNVYFRMHYLIFIQFLARYHAMSMMSVCLCICKVGGLLYHSAKRKKWNCIWTSGLLKPIWILISCSLEFY